MGKIIRRQGAGERRNYWAVKKWLSENAVSIVEVAREVGVKPTNGSRTIAGKMNHRGILRRLLELGCPPGILDLPLDMRDENNAGA